MKSVKELTPEVEAMIKERNERLDRFLGKYLPGSFWIGDPSAPAIIYNNKVLSCYAKNFNLIFNNASRGGSELLRLRINTKVGEENVDFIKSWSATEEYHRPVYRIRVVGTELYLAGFKNKIFEGKEQKFPIFIPKRGKIIFTKETAQSMLESYSESVNLEIV